MGKWTLRRLGVETTFEEAETEAVTVNAASLRCPAPDDPPAFPLCPTKGWYSERAGVPSPLSNLVSKCFGQHPPRGARPKTEPPGPESPPSPWPNGICTDIMQFSPAVDLGPHAVFPHTLKGCACSGRPWAALSSLPDSLPTAAPPHRGGHSLLVPMLLWDIAPESVPRSQVAFTKGQTSK